MAPMVGTTRHAANRIDLLEASLDPLRPSLLSGSTTAVVPDEVRPASGTYYVMYDPTGMECLQELATGTVEFRRHLAHDMRLADQSSALYRCGHYQSFVRVVATARRDALYSLLLRSASIAGWWGQSCRHAGDQAYQTSTSESCNVALEALCDVEANIASEIDQRGMATEVRTAVQLAKTEFSTLSGISLSTTQDPEIAERRRVKMTLYVSGTPEGVLEDEARFEHKLYDILGAGACEGVVLDYRWVR